jgi:cytosine deaminase
MAVCLDMITDRAAKLMRLDDYGIAVGKTADLVVWDAGSGADIIAKIALPLCSFKRGRRIFPKRRRLFTALSSHEGTWRRPYRVAMQR